MYLDIAAQAPAQSSAVTPQDEPLGAVLPLASASQALPDALESEAIAMNLEASLRIYNDRHLFAWTQGLLQSLLRHEMLICQMRQGDDDEPFETTGFSTDASAADSIGQLCRREPMFTDALISDWQAQHYRALIRDIDGAALSSDNALQKELVRIGGSRVIGHGTYDASGRTKSFFLFACRPAEAGAQQLRMAEMLVPFLHSAWMRTRVNLAGERSEGGASAPGGALLTEREKEVLKWMYMGKSNLEIGLILGISPLTVKNHVQAILRRLDVQNRAQAVGKAFKLHILSC